MQAFETGEAIAARNLFRHPGLTLGIQNHEYVRNRVEIVVDPEGTPSFQSSTHGSYVNRHDNVQTHDVAREPPMAFASSSRHV